MSGANGHPNSLPKTADIVILGAGVMGASLAFHLAKRKAGNIDVLDKDHVGRGGGGRSSALVRMHYSYPPEVQLALISLHMFQNWHEVVGAAVDLIGRQDLRELEPDWNVGGVELAAYEPDSGYGDGAGVAGDFLSAAREMGVTYLSRTQATELVVEGGHVRGVLTEQGMISAPIVISASGPWTRPLFQQAGCDLPIECEYHQVAILRNAPGMKGGGCGACIDSVTATYFRSDAHDKFLAGDFYGKRPVGPDNFPQRASDESLEEIIGRTCRRVPKLAGAEVMRGVTGVYDMTPDSRPLLGEIPEIGGLYVCAGFSGMGFKISPAVGPVMSELVLDGKGKSVDIRAFHPKRFVENQPIKAEYEYVDD